MLTTQVSVWVPIVVGLLGLAGVLGAQLIAGWREDRRWKREHEAEQARRSHEGRQDAYAKLIGLLEAWAWVLYPAQHQVLKAGGELTPRMRAELEEMRTLAREALGPVNLYAPEHIRKAMQPAILSKADLTASLLARSGRLDESERAELESLWAESKSTYQELRAALRRDLGIDNDV